MSEVIVITSGKGGVGKTTTTANIGAALALSGKKVVMIDTDIGLRNLDVIMGVENRIVYDLVDVVENRCTYSKALVRDKRFDGLFLLPAAQSKDKSAVTTTQMKHLVRQMEDSFDYILIDCPAGIEQGFENAVAAAKKASVVAMPEVSSVRDADRIIGLLEKHEIRDIKLDNPTAEELVAWWKTSGLPLKKFFNTSGLLYKSLDLKSKLPLMSDDEMLQLLATDGMLVKRPLLIGDGFVLVGFKESEWAEQLI